ncbi:DcaP family trimeric outer membrane transporter [Acinetobacter rudis]|uniref:Porin domain-containing protein n=1 Tax=Acinetobacter rudis CIP 110305 TaxID=421052 RepID=S3NMP5_9GAMM|nr:DcaP family trimeric outer membrane transporter [Acinetobacter rudis]EPF75564.1 hypothetical protein F945_01229 [Acinetobacter rudis CIP 110305]
MNKLKLNTLAVALGLSFSGIAQAAPSSEVTQLRNEVSQLRAMIEQMQTEQKKQAIVYDVQATKVVAPVVKVDATPRKGLGFTAGGAEFNIYGNVRADAGYQFEGGTGSLPYNQIANVPLTGNEGKDRLRTTLSATRLGLDFKTATQKGDVAGKIEVDFLGSNDALRIRHAYLTYDDWLIGQTWSNFAVPDYMPETIDALGYVGQSVKRTPQVRYTSKFNPTTSLVMALEDPKDNQADMKMRLPALTARLNHKFADNFAVSARAMAHDKKTAEDNKMAWGVGLGAKYDITPNTTLKADYYHVDGDSSFVSSSNQGFATDSTKNIMETNAFDSINIGVTQKFNTQWRGTLGFGYMKADNNKDYLGYIADKTKVNKDLWQGWGNVFYSPVQPLSFGLEYVYGERQTFSTATEDSKTGKDSRLNAVAIYSF